MDEIKYFKINDWDVSFMVNELVITDNTNYNAQTNASGNTVVDFINKKRVFKVGIIPLNQTNMSYLKTELDKFNVMISYLDPETGLLTENVECIIPSHEINYYSIRINNVVYKTMNLTFTEL